MKSLIIKIAAGLASLVCSTAFSQSATIIWGAHTDHGVAQQNGTADPLGSLVLLGSFGMLTTTQIHNDSAIGDLATLQANFTQFNTVPAKIGDGAPVSNSQTGPTSQDAGYWRDTSTNSSTTLNIQNKPIYYWVFNGTTIANSTQMGIFTAYYNGSGSVQPFWSFPPDGAVPSTITNDLDGVMPYSSATTIDTTGIVYGSYGTGTLNGFTAYDLAPVPEPSTVWSVAVVGTGLFLAAIRRRFVANP